MRHISIRFVDDLITLIPPAQRGKEIEVQYIGRRSAKDIIESYGVPHWEVGGIRVNGSPQAFSYIPDERDRLEVFPVTGRVGWEGCNDLVPALPTELTFVCDVHLGKLARLLRILGFDVNYAPQRDDAALALICRQEKRILLSRDRRLLMRNGLFRGQLIRSPGVDAQVGEVHGRFDLIRQNRPFSRCPACNGVLQRMDADDRRFDQYMDRIPAGVRQWNREYTVCSACRKVYWKGTHFLRLKERLENYFK